MTKRKESSAVCSASSPTKSTQKPSRKKQRLSTSGDYIGDSPYRGKTCTTDSDRDSDEGKALKPKSSVRNLKLKRKIPRVAGSNPKDPFQCLGDDEVSIIIAHLPAVATETLRRVSKLWKYLCEYHVGTGSLHQHFGQVEGKPLIYTNREEANLRFRRRLYHEQSLKMGRATSGFDATNASCWHINNGRLLWASYKNTYTIRNLSRRSETEAPDIEVNLNEFPWMKKRSLYLADILLTENGDVILVSESSAVEEMGDPHDPTEKHYIRRISPDCANVRWEVFVSDTRRASTYVYGKAAVDDHSIYRIESLKRVSIKSSYPLYFVARSLEDGKTKFEKKLPPVFGNSVCEWLGKIPDSADLELRTRGTLAVLSASRSPQVNIFDTFTGELLISYLRTMPSTLTLAAPGNVVYSLNFRYQNSLPSEFAEYDPTTKDLFTHSTRHLIQQYHKNTSGLGFDPDRKLFFRIHHRLARPNNVSGTNDPCTQISVIEATENKDYTGPVNSGSLNGLSGQTITNKHAFIEANSVALVTLPSATIVEKTRKIGKEKEEVLVQERRILELTAPWTIRGGDFFGMADDYLVYYAKGDHRLVVVDFWPTW